MSDVKWWLRWFAKHFPRLAYTRLTICRREGHGGRYDCIWCLRCGEPWFRNWNA